MRPVRPAFRDTCVRRRTLYVKKKLQKTRLNMTKKGKTEKDYAVSIVIEDVKDIKSGTLPSGQETLSFTASAKTVQGFLNDRGKFKTSLMIPAVRSSIAHEFDYDGHICFVDTNKLPVELEENKSLSHIAGVYILQVTKFTRLDDGAEIEIDHDNSVISCHPFDGRDIEKPERIGWQIAEQLLSDGNAKKAKIFVDSDLGDLKSLSQDLPDGFSFYYVSGDRQPNIYNKIFRRLDSLTRQSAKAGGPHFNRNDVIKFLWGKIDHLTPNKKSI